MQVEHSLKHFDEYVLKEQSCDLACGSENGYFKIVH